MARVALELGYEVVGVDNRPQPEYPCEFILADALHPPLRAGADLVWASPNCEGYSRLISFQPQLAKPRDVPQFREVCLSLSKHYVIENSDRCYDLRDPVRLCGFMFGAPFIRHRKFETSFCLPQPKHQPHNGEWQITTGKPKGGVAAIQKAMGLPGLSLESVTQAVPYCYTWYVLTWFKTNYNIKERGC